jgi:hypothetical protein
MSSLCNRALTALAVTVTLALPAFAQTPGQAANGYEKYLPDDTSGVITINVRQLLDSELGKKAGLDKALNCDDCQKTLQALNFDPMKDVERVVIASGAAGDTQVVIQGKFDAAKLGDHFEAAAKQHKDDVKVHKTADGKIYEATNLDRFAKQLPPQAALIIGDLKDKSIFLAIPDRGNVVLSPSKDLVTAALAKAAGTKTTKLTNKDLATLLAQVNPKQSLAVALPAPADEKKIKSITGGITVTGDVKVDFTVTATDADAAKEIDTAIDGQLQQVKALVDLAVLQQKELAPAAGLVAGIKHDAKDSTVGVKSDIKGETLEKLAKAVADLAAKTAGPKPAPAKPDKP